ncbi:MAG: excinuclease ABC subunit UvrC [Saprospiraceae bacterium]
MKDEDFKAMADSIPSLPGVYRFYDVDNNILYVGKAKNLKSRLSSYFGQKSHLQYKTTVLTKHASRIDFTIVESEHDALLLENTLIKAYQPRYNIMLKDGKTYTYICIKNERFPRVFFTRRVIKDGSTYFGPYTSKFKAKILLDISKKLFQLRTCSLALSPESIAKGKFKICLEYHIRNCAGPCEGFESEEEYNSKILQVKNILKGDFKEVRKYISERMRYHAEHLEYEVAQGFKEKMEILEDYQATSTVMSTKLGDVDVFAVKKDDKTAYVHYMKVVNGAVVNTDIVHFMMNLDDDVSDILSFAIPEIREKFSSQAKEIIVQEAAILSDLSINVTVPARGEKVKLLEMALQNIDYYVLQLKRDLSARKKQSSEQRILETLQYDLRMEVLPMHIECFDNSNIQGTNPVSSCVVFKNAKPSKKDYRHFKVKSVEGPNDFASMKEVVYRRYKRLMDEGSSLPQLIIIDGGKGQLSAAMESIESLGIQNSLTVIGIAKRLEEIFFPNDPIPLYINKKSESLKLIQHARNEAHRFAISFHRDLRSKNFLGTQLTNISGIGKINAEKLLKAFGSVQRIKDASLEEIVLIVGDKNAKKIVNYFNE